MQNTVFIFTEEISGHFKAECFPDRNNPVSSVIYTEIALLCRFQATISHISPVFAAQMPDSKAICVCILLEISKNTFQYVFILRFQLRHRNRIISPQKTSALISIDFLVQNDRIFFLCEYGDIYA